MTEDMVKKYIESMLGGSKVKIELEQEDFEQIIQQAIEKLRPYYSGVRYIQVNGANSPIDVSSHNIIEVVAIYETGSNGISQLQSQMFLNPGVFVYDNNFRDNYISYLTYAKLASAYQYTNQPSWKFDSVHQLLYLSRSKDVVLKALVELRVVTDIEEQSQWVGWFKDYALALARICVGEKRSKYTLSNAQYQLNGADILARGIADKQKLEDESWAKGSFPII